MKKRERLSGELIAATHGVADAFNYGARAMCSALSLLFLGLSWLCDYVHDDISTVRKPQPSSAEERHETPVPAFGKNHSHLR